MNDLVETLHSKISDYDPIHGLAVCDIINERIVNPIRDMEKGKIPKENLIKILEVAFDSNLIQKNFFDESMRRIKNHSRNIQVTLT